MNFNNFHFMNFGTVEQLVDKNSDFLKDYNNDLSEE